MNKKHIIVSFLAGILLAVFAYHAYNVYLMRSVLNAQGNAIAGHEATLRQVVEFLNKATQQPSK